MTEAVLAPGRYKWLLFDADDTLFDYQSAEAGALAETFADFGYPYEAAYTTTYRRINGALWAAFEQGQVDQNELRVRRFEQFFAALALPVDARVAGEKYLAHLGNQSRLLNGAVELVRALSEKYRLMLITNGIPEVQRPRLARSGIAGYFADIVISGEVGVAKPDARIFDEAFARMGQPRRADVLIIGDSLSSDMQGGCGYGIDTCWYNPGRKENASALPIKYEIDDLQALWSLL